MRSSAIAKIKGKLGSCHDQNGKLQPSLVFEMDKLGGFPSDARAEYDDDEVQNPIQEIKIVPASHVVDCAA
jgi:hypothetical protein